MSLMGCTYWQGDSKVMRRLSNEELAASTKDASASATAILGGLPRVPGGAPRGASAAALALADRPRRREGASPSSASSAETKKLSSSAMATRGVEGRRAR